MNWPENLRNTIDIDPIANFFVRMIDCKAQTILGMPVSRQHHEIEVRALFEPVDDWNNFVPLLHRQGAAGAKVVLGL